MIWVEYGWKYILYYYNRLIINNIANKNDGSNILYRSTSGDLVSDVRIKSLILFSSKLNKIVSNLGK